MTTINYQAVSRVNDCTRDFVARAVNDLESALELEGNQTEQASSVNACMENLQTVSGVLRLMQFNEAGILLQELNYLLKHIQAFPEEQRNSVLQTLYATLIDMPALIDGQFNGMTVPPQDYLNLINRIRKLRGVGLVFSLDSLLTNETVNFRTLLKKQSANFNRLFKKQADLYARALAELEAGDQPQAALKKLTRVFRNLEILNRDFRLGTLWGLCAALAQALDATSLKADSSALTLLCSYQPLLEKILQDGRRTLDQNISEKSLEKVFNELSKVALKPGERYDRLRVVKCWFNLDLALNRENRQRYSRIQAGFLQQEAGLKAARIFLDDIRQLSEFINQTIKDESCDEEIFRRIIAKLEVLTGTAMSLTIKPVRDILDAAIGNCVKRLGNLDAATKQGSAKAGAEFFAAILERCAQFLFKSELWLQAWIKRSFIAENDSASTPGQDAEILMPVDMFSDARTRLIQEVLKDLEILCVNLNDYVDAGCNPVHLAKPVAKLREVSAIMRMMRLDKTAALLTAVAAHLETVSRSGVHPDAGMGTEFFLLAETLIQVITYLELLTKGWNDEQRLEQMAGRMASLDAYFSATFPADPARAEILEEAVDAGDNQVDEQLQTTAESAQDAVPSQTQTAAADDEFALEIRETFIEESAEIVAELNELCETLKLEPGNVRALADCRRCFHTLKGSGRMVGAENIAEAALGFEDALNRIIRKGGSPDTKVVRAIADITEALPALMEDFRQHRDSAMDIKTLLTILAVPGDETLKAKDENPGSAFTMFIHEAEKQLHRISELLDQAAASRDIDNEITGHDFQIAVHTLAGSGKVAGLDEYAGLLRPLEKILESNPRLTLSATVVAAFNGLIAVTETLLQSLQEQGMDKSRMGRIMPADAEPFQQAVVELSLELSAIDSGQSEQQDEPEADPVLAGFLREAGQVLAQIARPLKQLESAADKAEVLATLKAQYALLEGAADSAGQEDFSRMSRMLSGSCGLLREKPAILNREVLAALQDSHDYLEQAHDALGSGARPEQPDMLIEILEAAVNPEIELVASEEVLKQPKGIQALADELQEMIDEAGKVESDVLRQIGNAEDKEETPEENPEQTDTAPQQVAEPQAVEQSQQAPQQELQQQSDNQFDVDESLLLTFLEEAEELLQELEGNLREWRDGGSATDVEDKVNDILRILHTLKGSAALVGEGEMSRQAHQFESFLIDSRQRRQPVNADFFSSAAARLKVLELLYALYHREDNGRLVRDRISEAEIGRILNTDKRADKMGDKAPSNPQSLAKVYADAATDAGNKTPPQAELATQAEAEPVSVQHKDAEQVTTLPDPGPATETSPETVKDKTKASRQAAQDENVRVSGKLLKSLLNDVYQINISHNRMESSIGDLVTQLNEIEATSERLQNYMKTIEEQARTAYQSSLPDGSRYDGFDSLEMESYSEMQQIALSLREDYEDLREIKSNLVSRIKDVDGMLHEQQNSANNLQQGLISSQLIPFASLFPRLRRLTHQVSETLGKDVSVVFRNTEDRLDRSVIQVLVNPLEHMIRNAIDHGIEAPAERKRQGKPEQAEIRISLYRKGANILLDISDDGAGINVDKVRKKALASGLLKKDARLSQKELLQFLLQAGFSTSESLSSISGRGVGLDVVAREVSQIGGDLEILSDKGKGTTFRIHLPMTSALHRCLQFSLLGQQYVVLMSNIDAIMREPVDRLQERYNGQRDAKIDYAGKTYELKYLGSMLDDRSKPEFDPFQQSAPLLLVSGEKRNFAMQIDSIIKSNDLMVRSLGTQFSVIPGLGGGVILGDGQIVLVLDPESIANAYAERELSLFRGFFHLDEEEAEEVFRKTVLVVDDSLTVRKVTSMILERHGINVLLAKNGLEAVEILKNTRPDVVLLDIEMPKMDGFEVASFIRNDQGLLKDLPIIMITSRVGEKHRSRAAEIGVNQYMCKPFQEENLMEAISVYH